MKLDKVWRTKVFGLAAAGMVFTLACAGAAASEIDGIVVSPDSDGQFDTVVFFGPDVSMAPSAGGIGFDIGVVHALNGDIQSDGFAISGNLGYGYNYDTSSTPTGEYDNLSARAMLGYVWQRPDFYLGIFSGLEIQDEYDRLAGTGAVSAGLTAELGFESKRVDSLYAEIGASFSTIDTRVYGRARGGYKTASLRYGGELTYFGDATSSPTYRVGAFVGDIPLGQLDMTASGGVSNGPSGGGVYGQLEFSLPMDLR